MHAGDSAQIYRVLYFLDRLMTSLGGRSINDDGDDDDDDGEEEAAEPRVLG